MSAPKQTVGLTNFFGSFSKCPPNPDAVKAIVFTDDNLAVTNGSKTDLQISLANFFILVDNASMLNFTVEPLIDSTVPYTLTKLDLSSIGGTSDSAKFIGLLPNYGTGTSTVSANSMYLEWAIADSIESNNLKISSDKISVNENTSLNFDKINKLAFSLGSHLNYSNIGSGEFFAATDGGLLKWDGNKLKLYNTLNTNSSTDYINTINIDSNNIIWLGTNQGLYNFSHTTEAFNELTKINDSLFSKNVHDIKIENGKLFIATDKGLSISDSIGEIVNNFTIYNSPLFKHGNISSLTIKSSVAFAGTTGGVYIFDSTINKWNKFPLNSTTVNGWTASNSINSIESDAFNLYIGTSNGLVILPHIGLTGATSYPVQGLTATTIAAGGSGPYESSIQSLKLDSNTLYVGHNTNAVSIMDTANNNWIYAKQISLLNGAKVNDILVDSLSGTFYSGNNISGLVKILGATYSNVPGVENSTDILLSIPGATTTPNGSYILDSSSLYSINQPLLIIFSKGMTGTNINSYITLSKGLTGESNNIQWSSSFSDQNYKIMNITATASFTRSAGYNLSLAVGCTSADNSYVSDGLNIGFYTENIEPVDGWNVMGKIMFLSGSDIKNTESIYLRNPQTTGVNIVALIGK